MEDLKRSLPGTLGPRCSEVKEEGRAQPGPGDMSGGGDPAAPARAIVDVNFGGTGYAFLMVKLAA